MMTMMASVNTMANTSSLLGHKAVPSISNKQQQQQQSHLPTQNPSTAISQNQLRTSPPSAHLQLTSTKQQATNHLQSMFTNRNSTSPKQSGPMLSPTALKAFRNSTLSPTQINRQTEKTPLSVISPSRLQSKTLSPTAQTIQANLHNSRLSNDQNCATKPKTSITHSNNNNTNNPQTSFHKSSLRQPPSATSPLIIAANPQIISKQQYISSHVPALKSTIISSNKSPALTSPTGTVTTSGLLPSQVTSILNHPPPPTSTPPSTLSNSTSPVYTINLYDDKKSLTSAVSPVSATSTVIPAYNPHFIKAPASSSDSNSLKNSQNIPNTINNNNQSSSQIVNSIYSSTQQQDFQFLNFSSTASPRELHLSKAQPQPKLTECDLAIAHLCSLCKSSRAKFISSKATRSPIFYCSKCSAEYNANDHSFLSPIISSPTSDQSYSYGTSAIISHPQPQQTKEEPLENQFYSNESKQQQSQQQQMSQSTEYHQKLNQLNASHNNHHHFEPTTVVTTVTTSTTSHIIPSNIRMTSSDISHQNNENNLKKQKLSTFSSHLQSAKSNFSNLLKQYHDRSEKSIAVYHSNLKFLDTIQTLVLQTTESLVAASKSQLISSFNASLGKCKSQSFQAQQILNYLHSTERDLQSNIDSIISDMDISSLDDIIREYTSMINSYEATRRNELLPERYSQLEMAHKGNCDIVNQFQVSIYNELTKIFQTKETTFCFQDHQTQQPSPQQLPAPPLVYLSFENKDTFPPPTAYASAEQYLKGKSQQPGRKDSQSSPPHSLQSPHLSPDSIKQADLDNRVYCQQTPQSPYFPTSKPVVQELQNHQQQQSAFLAHSGPPFPITLSSSNNNNSNPTISDNTALPKLLQHSNSSQSIKKKFVNQHDTVVLSAVEFKSNPAEIPALQLSNLIMGEDRQSLANIIKKISDEEQQQHEKDKEARYFESSINREHSRTGSNNSNSNNCNNSFNSTSHNHINKQKYNQLIDRIQMSQSQTEKFCADLLATSKLKNNSSPPPLTAATAQINLSQQSLATPMVKE